MPVIDRRKKNGNWQVVDEHDKAYKNANAALMALLMDIRDELQTLNQRVLPLRNLDCANFLSIPVTLAHIVRNTEPKPKRRKKAK